MPHDPPYSATGYFCQNRTSVNAFLAQPFLNYWLMSQCPLWVKSGPDGPAEECPLYARKQTSGGRIGMSAKCHLRTHALQQKLFDHLVGAKEERGRNLDAQGPRCRQIDD